MVEGGLCVISVTSCCGQANWDGHAAGKKPDPQLTDAGQRSREKVNTLEYICLRDFSLESCWGLLNISDVRKIKSLFFSYSERKTKRYGLL